MPRDTLTKEQIVQAAIALLDAEGIEGLSMRRLGARLGSAATAVYWHVGSKDDLIVLASDAVWNEIALPDLQMTEWTTAATEMAHDLYAMILRHPWLMPAMSTHLIYGPGKARHDDHLLAVYEGAGFPPPEAQQAATVVVTFVLGTALGVTSDIAWRARLRRAGKEAHIPELLARTVQIAAAFPRLREAGEPPEDPAPGTAPAHDLDYGLPTILNGLQARLPPAATPQQR